MVSSKPFVRDGSDISNGSDDEDDTPLLSRLDSDRSASNRTRTAFQLRIHRAPVNQKTTRFGSNSSGKQEARPSVSHDEPSHEGDTTVSDTVDWKSILGVCLCLFWIHCQPSEAYLTRYLLRDKHISEDDLDKYVWPVDTYVALATLLPLGFLAEIIGYRLVVFIGLLLREATRCILIFGSTVPEMALMQGTYAWASSTDTILIALAFMLVPRSLFQRISVATVCAQHAGSLLGSGIAQVMADRHPDRLVDLFYASWACTSIGVGCFLALVNRPTRPAPTSLVSVLLTEGWHATVALTRKLYSQCVVCCIPASLPLVQPRVVGVRGVLSVEQTCKCWVVAPPPFTTAPLGCRADWPM
eukprot:m.140792 g.140792  ORF g.140792 m.140792 type:complete len:357 (-) comp17665_c0_seq13:4871-5941(-)